METSYKAFLASGYWQDVRYQKLEINPRCERCNSTKQVQVHHKRYRKSWYDVKVEDLETLCRECHKKEHGIKPSQDETHRACVIRRKLAKIKRQLWKQRRTERQEKKPLRDGNFAKINGRIVFNPQ